MPDDLITLVLRPLRDPDSVDRRLRWLLKRMKRWDGLECVHIAGGPEAWAVWRKHPDAGWVRVATGVSPQLALALSGAVPEVALMLLPHGVKP